MLQNGLFNEIGNSSQITYERVFQDLETYLKAAERGQAVILEYERGDSPKRQIAKFFATSLLDQGNEIVLDRIRYLVPQLAKKANRFTLASFVALWLKSIRNMAAHATADPGLVQRKQISEILENLFDKPFETQRGKQIANFIMKEYSTNRKFYHYLRRSELVSQSHSQYSNGAMAR